MVKTATELNLKVRKARLLTKQELIDHLEQMPKISYGCCWWLADLDAYGDAAYAEGNYIEEDMYCSKDEPNTWLRVALDIEGDANEGDEFVYCGYVFTALSNDLAISNNFLGCAKYFDEEALTYITDGSDDCTIDAIIDALLQE